jgi:heme exporter protein CcmD
MSHDPHFGFVVAAYALALVIVAAMVVTILADYTRLKQALASLSRETRKDPDPESLE